MSKVFSSTLLGENPKKNDQILIFSTTFLAIGVIGYFNFEELSKIPIWKSLLFLFIVLDIVAGAIANFTTSSQKYYKNDTTKRIVFLFTHFIHLGLLVLAVGHIWYCLAVLIFTIIGALIVNFTASLKQQEINASVIINLGIILFYVVFPAPQIIVWLPAILLIKLVFGFSINREK